MPASTFSRGPERLRCEQHQDRAGFALVLSTPGGGSITRRFADAVSLSRRRLALEQMLTTAGWVVDAPDGRGYRVSFTDRP